MITFRNKGESLRKLPADYVVIDIETTGFDPKTQEIIELSAVKVRNDAVVDQFTTLCRPKARITSAVTKINGITNDMVKDAPRIDEVLESYLSFIGNDIIIGHNISFDINFINTNCINLLGKAFDNYFIDTLGLSREACGNLRHHRLSDMVEYFNIDNEPLHRGLNDCHATHQVYLRLKGNIKTDGTPSVSPGVRKPFPEYISLKGIKAKVRSIDKTHPCYGKYFSFTGVLKIERIDAARIVANLGGINENTVTKKTNYLVKGSYDDISEIIKDGKTNNHKKAEEFILKGHDLQIITEDAFFDMVGF
jgi:DNA polymerase-3 subunit epsilon